MKISPFVFAVHRAKASDKGRYAVIISGDGLRTRLSAALARKLAAGGITTARVKALRYFWSARSPKRMAKDLEHQLRRRLRRRPHDRFLLIGFSFGAGTLPFAVNRLPEDLRGLVDGVALLAPPADVDFEFFFRSWFHRATKTAILAAPEIKILSSILPVLYMRGEDDYIGPSGTLKPGPNLTITALPGGHDFNKDYDRLAALIMAHFPPV